MGENQRFGNDNVNVTLSIKLKYGGWRLTFVVPENNPLHKLPYE